MIPENQKRTPEEVRADHDLEQSQTSATMEARLYAGFYHRLLELNVPEDFARELTMWWVAEVRRDILGGGPPEEDEE